MTDLNKKVILMAEDDEDDRFLLENAANELTFPIEVSFVKDGEQLLDYLSHIKEDTRSSPTNPPDLILLDINLPGKNGLEALESIKTNESLRSIPVVIWSTSSQKNHILKAGELGAVDYVIKPDTFEGLIEALKRVISNLDN